MLGHKDFHIQFLLEINERNRLTKPIMRMFINSVNQCQGGEMYSVGTKSIILFQDKRFRIKSNSVSYFTV